MKVLCIIFLVISVIVLIGSLLMWGAGYMLSDWETGSGINAGKCIFIAVVSAFVMIACIVGLALLP